VVEVVVRPVRGVDRRVLAVVELSGKRTTTPVETMLMMLAMIENVWLVEWRANSVSKPWVLNGKTGEVIVTACSITGRPAFYAAS
jgi:hypothetical protein